MHYKERQVSVNYYFNFVSEKNICNKKGKLMKKYLINPENKPINAITNLLNDDFPIGTCDGSIILKR